MNASGWKDREGVLQAPDFDEYHYWGEIPRIQLQHILHSATSLGPTRALERWARATGNSYLETYALDSRRALCLELANLPESPVILDYGCGYGTMGLAAAPFSRIVYLVDAAWERILFAHRRAKELGASNVVALACQDWRSLPISAGSLDLVILNGILEWIPVESSGDPLQTQLDFLAAMYRLLSPGGAVYIGIENRYALRYFGGYPDDHTDLRFTSLMPRRIADIYCHVRTGKRYRTLTWSLSEHRRQLTALGFGDVEIYCLYPDYRFPNAACNIEDHFALQQLQAQAATLPGRLIKKLISRLRLWPHLVYSYGIIARKTSTINQGRSGATT